MSKKIILVQPVTVKFFTEIFKHGIQGGILCVA